MIGKETKTFEIVFPNNANSHNNLFGGHALSLMDRLAFQASSYTFTGIPVEISEVADLPEEEAGAEDAGSETTIAAPEEAVAQVIEEVSEAAADAEEEAKDPNQPEIKQHIDGNSVIFEVIPPEKEGE